MRLNCKMSFFSWMNVYQSPAWRHNVILAKNKHSSFHDASHTIAKTSINTLSSQDGTMDTYIKLLQEHRVSHLVCATDQAYHTEDLCKSGAKKFFSFFIKIHFVLVITCTGSNTFHSSGPDLSIPPLLGANGVCDWSSIQVLQCLSSPSLMALHPLR